MSDKPSDKPDDFQPVNDPIEYKSLLREAAKTLASTFLWTKDQKQSLKTHIDHYSDTDRSFYAWCPPDVDPKSFMNDLAESKDANCFFSVSLARANIFFKAPFKTMDDMGLKFAQPERIFKVQRRKDIRFRIPDGHVVKVEFPDPLFPEKTMVKKVFDLSAGGLSFIVPADEVPLFPKDLSLGIHFTINNRKLRCQCIVKHVQELPAGGRVIGTKIGVQFGSILPGETQFIASYVFEESRKFYSKYL